MGEPTVKRSDLGRNAPSANCNGPHRPQLPPVWPGLQLRRATRRSAAARFSREREAILRLARGCDPEQGARRVLIPQPRGLEDSSRYWSVFMTVDHLRIVNQGTAEVITQLSRGEAPARASSTADVKPVAGADATVIEAFERACDHFEQCVAAVENLRTEVRYAHPWFGPLDAADWHVTTAFHMGLHRRQIETILQALTIEFVPSPTAPH